MTRQLDGYQELSTAVLEERLWLLEYRVAALTEAVHELRVRCRGSHYGAEDDARAGEGIGRRGSTP